MWNDNWKEETQPEEKPEEEKPEEEKPEVKTGKARLVWIDAAANFKDYANSKKNIADDMARLKETGFTGVIVEVSTTTAGVLFNSDVEGPVTQVDAWVTGGYVWLKRTENFDYLQEFIDAGKKVGLDVYAAITRRPADASNQIGGRMY